MEASRIAVAYDCLFPYTTGGGERQYRAFAEAMAARGRRVDYLTSTQWEGAPPSDAAFHVVPVSGELDLYDDEGVRRTGPALRFAWQLFRALRTRRAKYDAVLVSGLPVLNVFAARAALLGTGKPLVVDYLEVWGRHQWASYAGALTGTLAWVLQRLAVALTPIATCHSQLTAGRLRREGLRGRLLVSPGLIDAHADSRAIPRAADHPPFVLYAGRHIPDKRVESLPAAVAVARRTIPDLRLVILGSGPTTAAVTAAVDAAAGREWTDLPGFVEQTDLDELLAGAACLANPSRREGYGLVVVEAAAHGTPVVLVEDEDNAATELVEDAVNGFVAASASPPDLAAAIVSAVRGGSTLRSSTRGWFDSAVQTRTITRTTDNILAAMDAASTVTGGGRPPSATPEGGQS